MTDWAAVIRQIAPRGKRSIIAGLADAMPRIIQVAGLTSARRQAHFLAQVAHESDGFATTVEYASGAAYEGRADLGNTHAGDGKRFKGRGLIQLTGRANYAVMAGKIGVDFVGKPELAAQFPWAALTAAYFWAGKGLNAAADADDLRGVTKKVNGGFNGLPQRAAYLKSAKRALAARDPILNPPPRAGEGPDAADEPLTAADLRRAGSRTIAGTDQVKSNLGGALATAGGAVAVVSQGADIATQAQGAATSFAAVNSSTGALDWARHNWHILTIVVLVLALAWCIWRIYAGARTVERARVDDARGETTI